jgi:formate--tetrahydrofolate ligase
MEALSPNLVQTLEGTPAFIHGGPFANIAHGAIGGHHHGMKLCDYVQTGSGLGATSAREISTSNAARPGWQIVPCWSPPFAR